MTTDTATTTIDHDTDGPWKIDRVGGLIMATHRSARPWTVSMFGTRGQWSAVASEFVDGKFVHGGQVEVTGTQQDAAAAAFAARAAR